MNARLATLLRPGSLVILLAATVFGVAALMRELDFPRTGTWEAGSFPAVALVVAATVTYAGYVLVVFGYRRTLRRSDEEAELYKACRDIAALVERKTKLERDAIGVHVWSVRGLPGVQRLERRATFVPGERQPTAIVWRRGKGAIGRCWAEDEWVLADLESLQALAPDDHAFAALPREERFGFTWSEFRATSHYKGILAWPLHGGPAGAPRVAGCVSIDVQARGAAAELERFLDGSRPALSAHLAVCEAVLRPR